jgi:hypothetical protein
VFKQYSCCTFDPTNKNTEIMKLTKSQIDTLTTDVENTLDSLGMFTWVSKSTTLAGNSNYVQVYASEEDWMNKRFSVKIRISDHTTTNNARVTGERHYDGSDRESLISEMKRIFNK